MADRAEFVRQFEAEAQIVAGLEHLHIVPLYDFWREPGAAYLVMPFMRGGSLAGVFDDGSWSADRTLALVEQVGDALSYAHRRGVVHCDVHPGNVLLDEEGNAYLADFGIAVTLVSLLFTDFSVHSPLIVLLVALLTSCLFALAGLINAIFANSFDDITIIPTFVLTPLTYLGGIFYSIKLLPEFWQQVSLGNPILYMVNSFRYGFRGTSDIDLLTAIIVILFFIALLFIISLTLLSRGTGIRQ